MLRSKLHRPWYPRMHDGLVVNPLAPYSAPEPTLGEQIATLEAEATMSLAEVTSAPSEKRTARAA